MLVKKYTLLFLSLLTLTQVYSQIGGNYVYSFLDLPIPARTAALGGNTIAIKDDDISTAFQNPALLSKRTSNTMALSYIKYLGDIKYGYFAYGRSFDKVGHFAVGMQQVGYGTFSQRDEYGNETGLFHANDYCFNLSYARDKDSLFTYGATLKTIYSNYANYTSVGSAIDLGATYSKPSRQITFSGVIKNIGMQWKTYTGNAKEKLPYNIQFGASAKVPKAPFRMMVMYDHLNKWDLTYTDPNNPPATEDPFTHEPIKQHPFKKWLDKAGRHFIVATEIIITKNFNIRVGYNYKMRKELVLPDKQGLAGFSMGFGFRIYKFHLSYAHSQYMPGFGSNHFSITTNLSTFMRPAQQAPQPVQDTPVN
jgi:hypothetical protein